MVMIICVTTLTLAYKEMLITAKYTSHSDCHALLSFGDRVASNLYDLSVHSAYFSLIVRVKHLAKLIQTLISGCIAIITKT